MANDYELKFSDSSKTFSIIVPSTESGTGINNYDTSLDLVGSGYNNYGFSIAQNFLKLVENFSAPSAPANAIEGQIWYDTSNPNKKILRVNNGTLTGSRWQPVSGIFQQPNDPSLDYSSVVTDGDLWIDTSSTQLKLRAGTSWVLIGPNFTSGPSKTGTEAVFLESNTGAIYPVILNWINGKVVEIISYNDFTPRTVIDGFFTVKAGSNLTSKVVTKYNGIADKANFLLAPNGLTYGIDNILKNKANSQTHTGTFIVESGSGLKIQNTSIDRKIEIFNNASGSFIEFTNNNSSLLIGNSLNSYLRFNATNGNIGINTSTSASSPTLDVAGGARFISTVTINLSTFTNVGLSLNGSFSANGNLNLNKDLTVLGNSILQGTIRTGKTVGSGSIIVPSINNAYDIGSTTSSFRTIYVSNIGTTNTNVNIYGTVYGTTTRLETSRNFSIFGQVTATTVSFNGTNNALFETNLTRKVIEDQQVTSETTASQTLLILNTSSNTSNLEKISKADFLSDVYPNIVLPGIIAPYGGSVAPSGWLLCDGSSYFINAYLNLYSVIGTTYGNNGAGTFRVPNMSQSTTVTNSTSFIKYIIKT